MSPDLVLSLWPPASAPCSPPSRCSLSSVVALGPGPGRGRACACVCARVRALMTRLCFSNADRPHSRPVASETAPTSRSAARPPPAALGQSRGQRSAALRSLLLCLGLGSTSDLPQRPLSGLSPALATAAPAACNGSLTGLPQRILHAGAAIIFLKCRWLPVTAPPETLLAVSSPAWNKIQIPHPAPQGLCDLLWTFL